MLKIKQIVMTLIYNKNSLLNRFVRKDKIGEPVPSTENTG